MTKILALIDADSLVYQSLRDTLEESIDALDEKFQNILDSTKCTNYTLFISKGKYFRHELSKDEYKSTRKYPDKTSWLKPLKAVLEVKYNAVFMYGVEADDLVHYWYNNESTSSYTKIICSADKDLLKGVPGKHFNYTYTVDEDSFETKKGSWVEITQEEAELFLKMQMIVGDSSDGVKGLFKKGIKYWEKLIHSKKTITWSDIFQEYLDHYIDVATAIYEFQLSFRQLYILRDDKDFIREVNVVPEPLKINEVSIRKKDTIKYKF